jgi:hypothetical protein
MKPTAILAIVACTAVAAFLVGRMGKEKDDVRKSSRDGAVAASRSAGRSLVETRADRPGKRPPAPQPEAASGVVTLEQARSMTREERLAMIEKGAKLAGGTAQKDLILGVIGALQAGEMRDAVDLIGKAQRNGNYQAPEVWAAMWTQWGKVAPEDCFARFRERPEGKGRNDVRNTMRGWLETAPASALAWAKQPDRTPLEASAAALAISHGAQGDAAKLQATILDLPEGVLRKETLKDLYDMEGMKDGGRSPAVIYTEMPETLKADAWSVTAQRLAFSDQEAAKSWITEHAGEPGTDYGATQRMVMDLANGDAAAATKWAVDLPGLPNAEGEYPAFGIHPVAIAGSRWLQVDPEGFKTWLATQPQDQVWVKRFHTVIERPASGGTGRQAAPQ